MSKRTLDDWMEFSKRDDCLDKMVPSDLREIIGLASLKRERGVQDCVDFTGFIIDRLENDAAASEGFHKHMRHAQAHFLDRMRDCFRVLMESEPGAPDEAFEALGKRMFKSF